jgi:uncharacterized protein (TIGR00299 family) protein
VTTAWFHCFSGIAGDMALGALLDAGAPLEDVTALVARLPLSGWALSAEPVLRGGIGGTKVHVSVEESTVVRTAAHIQGLVTEAHLPQRVEARALAVFGALAEAEGRLHRRPPDQVHFHEVGGIDAIVDVVGTCAALEVLDVDEVACSPVAVGLGMVRAAHGIIPNPAPAVVELLRGVPTHGVDLAVELTTPTGAALVAALSTRFGALPPVTVTATGFGAGHRELDDRPNLTQVVLGDPARPAPRSGQPQLLLEANVDDATGEVLAHTVAELLRVGAADAWITPVVGKKGRPAHVISALCDPALLGPVRHTLIHESGTLGVRGLTTDRWPEPRRLGEVAVADQPVRVKVGPGRVKAEFDDAARVATSTGRPLRSVLAEAEARWREEGPAEPVLPGRRGDRIDRSDRSDHPVHGHPHPHGPHDHDHDHDHDHRDHDDRPPA